VNEYGEVDRENTHS